MPNIFDQYLATPHGIFSVSEIATLESGLPVLSPSQDPVILQCGEMEPVEGIIIRTGLGMSFIVSTKTLVETETGWVQANKLRDHHRILLNMFDTRIDPEYLDLRLYNQGLSEMPQPIYYDEGMAYGQGVAYGMVSDKGQVIPSELPEGSMMAIQGFPEGATPDNCFAPWELYRSPSSVILSFLKGVYKIAGGCDSESITLKVKSYTFAAEIQFFLIYLGIISSVSYDGEDVVVRIDTIQSAKKFKTFIGFNDDKKDGFLEVFLDNYPDDISCTVVLSSETSLLNSYKIPEVRPFYLGPICIHPR